MRRLPALALITAVLAAIQVGRLGMFMADGQRRDAAVLSHYDTFVRHSCLSAYHRAVALARAGERDIYRPDLYGGSAGVFHQELYEYPPPFLLLPAALEAVVGADFPALRLSWFVLSLALVLVGFAVVARFVGGEAGQSAVLLAPAVLASQPTLLALQYGNFHLPAVALAMVALAALYQEGAGWRRLAVPLGGAALAFVAWAKIFPALLLVPLAVERRWRAVLWTGAWAVIWLLLVAAVFGPAPVVAFFHHQLGHVASGAAFPFLAENDRLIAANLSAYALVQKAAGLLGAEAPPPGLISAGYALALVAALARAARRRAGGDRLALARLALAALFLGALISPFAPQPYASFAGLWLMALLVPGSSPRRAASLVVGWLALAVMVHVLPMHAERPMLALSLLGQLLALLPALAALARAP